MSLSPITPICCNSHSFPSALNRDSIRRFFPSFHFLPSASSSPTFPSFPDCRGHYQFHSLAAHTLSLFILQAWHPWFFQVETLLPFGGVLPNFQFE
ncbi:hypothetical protein V6Z11_D01G147000 [Gossypium hirsutum]